MAFKNYIIKSRELFPDFTQLPPLLTPKLNYIRINRVQNDNKRLSVGQMVVNNEEKIVSLNQKFISIWSLPQCIVTARCEQQVIRFVTEQLSNPKCFSVNIKNIGERTLPEIQDRLKTKDGRCFSYLIKPQWFEKRVIGRIYQFRFLP